MSSQKNPTAYLNVPSEVISSQTSQHLAWPISPDEITDTALLASCLREKSKHSTDAAQLIPYHELAQRIFQRFAFEKQSFCTLSLVQEVVVLVQAASNIDYYQWLMGKLQSLSEHSSNIAALQGLAALMRHRACSAQADKDKHLAADCKTLLTHSSELLIAAARKNNALQLSVLLQTVLLLLETMFDAGLDELDFPKQKENLEKFLNAFINVKEANGHKNVSLVFQANYALQSLKRLNNSKSGWQKLWAITQDFGGGVAYAIGAVSSLEPDKFWEAFSRISEGAKKVREGCAYLYKGDEWYLALHHINQGIKSGYLKGLEKFVQTWQLPQKDCLLQGLCFCLERVALSSTNEKTQEWALSLLNSLARGADEWGQSKNSDDVKACALEAIERVNDFQLPLDVRKLEREANAPPSWHPFWQGQPQTQSKLLQAVQAELKQHGYQQLLPSIKDGMSQNTLALQVISSGVSTLRQNLIPTSPTNCRNQIKKLLKDYYEPNLKVQRISGKALDLDCCYINLGIIESEERQEKIELEEQLSTFYRLSSYKKIEETNLRASISIEKLFDKRKLRDGKKGTPKRILIQGRAGIGKTTLCKKLVHLYQRGLWQRRFDAVLWLPLRQLKTYGVNNFKELLIKKYFSHLSDSEKENFADQLIRHSDKILFVLDGLDEVAIELKREGELADFLAYLLRQPQVVVTSRPTGIDSSTLKEFDLELETIGFSQENVQAYLEKVEPKFAADIQELIIRIPVIQELINIPVQLDALCYSWQEIKAKLEPQEARDLEVEAAIATLTIVYQAMFDKLWRKDAERLNKELGGRALCTDDLTHFTIGRVAQLMADEIDYLSYLAFKALQDNLIEFDLIYLKEVAGDLEEKRKKQLSWDVQLNIKRTSFVHTIDAVLTEEDRAYHFLHLTFQEFFAAKFLAKHLQAYLTAQGEYKKQVKVAEDELVLTLEELQEFIAKHKYDPYYQYFWYMTVGLLEGEALTGFFCLLKKDPRDLIGGGHLHLIMHCLHIARARLPLDAIVLVEDELMKGFELELKLRGKYRSSLLAQQPEFPEHLLLAFMRKHEQYRYELFQVLEDRQFLFLFEQIIEVCVEALQDEDSGTRVRAVRLLRSYLDDSEEIREALIDMTADEESFVVEETITVLAPYVADFEEIRQIFIEMLESEDVCIREKVVKELAPYVSSFTQIHKALMNKLKRDVFKVRAAAVEALCSDATSFEQVQAILIDVSKDRSSAVREVVAQILGSYIGRSEQVQGLLIKMLKDKSSTVRAAAVRALGEDKNSFEQTQEILIKMLRDESVEVAIATIKTFLNHSVSAEQMREIIKMLENDDPEIKCRVINRLAPHALGSGEIRKAFIKKLKDRDLRVRLEVAEKLMSCDPKSVAKVQETLIELLKDERDWIRRRAASLLGLYASVSAQVESALIRMLEDEAAQVRVEAAAVLISHKANARQAREILIKNLEHTNFLISSHAAKGLTHYAVDLKDILDAIICLLGTEYANGVYDIFRGRPGQAHLVLPHLSSDQLQAFYTKFLLPYSYKFNAPLYYDGQALHFYTAIGQEEPIPLSNEQYQNIAHAFTQAKENILARTLSH